MMTNAAQAIVWHAKVEPFGKVLIKNQTIVNNVRLPGQYEDVETGLSQNGFRDGYDPGRGRYTQVDPIGLEGGINPYIYVENNPLIYSDPTGLVKHTAGKPISCGNCTIRIDYTFDEKTGKKINHLHWNCKGKEGACGENGEKSHGGSWEDAPENVKACARARGFKGDSSPTPAPTPNFKVPSPDPNLLVPLIITPILWWFFS